MERRRNINNTVCKTGKIILIEDTRNKVGEHNNILSYCKRNGIVLVREVLKVGDYMFPDGNISVDTKKKYE